MDTSSLELIDPDEGPAEPGSPLRAALDMLIVQGCKVQWVPPAVGVMEVYECFYRVPLTALHENASYTSCRMFYPDARGTKQALELLQELATSPADPLSIKPTKLIVPKALESVARNMLRIQKDEP